MNTLLLFVANKVSHILPDTRCFALKRWLYRYAGVRIGKNVRICSSVNIFGCAGLTIGDEVWIGHDCLIIASADIVIGSHVNIAPRTYIGTGTHDIDISGYSIAGKGRSNPIMIKDGAWLCANSQIMGGVTIGDCSIVAMGAVIIRDVPDYELWGGVPGKRIRVLK